jgi:thiamine-monophosphate kinase
MPRGEFDLIDEFFNRSPQRSDVLLAIGDDCALLEAPTSEVIALSVDTLVSGVHFFEDVPAKTLGHKSLAVNLSDLAATGAEPLWCTLALTLPEIDRHWLADFSDGFHALAHRSGIDLVGGDTTHGPLAITVHVMGRVPKGNALLRSGASPGDLIYVSGPIGGAGYALEFLRNPELKADAFCLKCLQEPDPRVTLGISLRGLASACIDISDGLAADLGHILSKSNVGATIHLEKIPVAPQVRAYMESIHNPGFPLCTGDDYELCFTVPPHHQSRIDAILESLNLDGGCIGQTTNEPGLSIQSQQGALYLNRSGYEHFR